MLQTGNRQNNSGPRILVGRLVLAGGVGLTILALSGCYSPNRDLVGANAGMSAPPAVAEGEGEGDDAVDTATLREILTETGSTIQRGDEISISVYQDERLDGTYRIDNDGGFQWHYVGQVKTTGLTTNDLRRKLTDVAGIYLTEPSVIVNYISQRPRSIRVLGQARAQGHFALTRNMRLVDAIAAAGGIQDP